MPNRRVEIPKGNGKFRTLQIPCIRERAVQGALKLILEAVFEADFCPNSYGFRPKRSPHRALAEVRRSVMRRMSTVIDVGLSRYFDTIRHSVLLDNIAKRIQDPPVMHLVKQIIQVGVKIGVPQGGPFSPLAEAKSVKLLFSCVWMRTIARLRYLGVCALPPLRKFWSDRLLALRPIAVAGLYDQSFLLGRQFYSAKL
jgi:hypothetical protein